MTVRIVIGSRQIPTISIAVGVNGCPAVKVTTFKVLGEGEAGDRIAADDIDRCRLSCAASGIGGGNADSIGSGVVPDYVNRLGGGGRGGSSLDIPAIAVDIVANSGDGDGVASNGLCRSGDDDQERTYLRNRDDGRRCERSDLRSCSG